MPYLYYTKRSLKSPVSVKGGPTLKQQPQVQKLKVYMFGPVLDDYL